MKTSDRQECLSYCHIRIEEKVVTMAKLFWVTCPGCSGRFCAHYEELRHNKKVQLLCPYCGKRFFDEESPHVED